MKKLVSMAVLTAMFAAPALLAAAGARSVLVRAMRVLEASEGRDVATEGGFAIPDFTDTVLRRLRLEVSAAGLDGERQAVLAEGFLARAICDEGVAINRGIAAAGLPLIDTAYEKKGRRARVDIESASRSNEPEHAQGATTGRGAIWQHAGREFRGEDC